MAGQPIEQCTAPIPLPAGGTTPYSEILICTGPVRPDRGRLPQPERPTSTRHSTRVDRRVNCDAQHRRAHCTRRDAFSSPAADSNLSSAFTNTAA